MKPTSNTLMSNDDNRRMFDRIAPHYDLLNRLMSFGLDVHWRRAAVRALDPQSSGTYLDLGCGTGALAFAVARCAPGAVVVGVDPSTRMLNIAEQRRANRCSDNVSFEVGDAYALKAGDGRFDGAITGFCVRNMADRPRAWEELHRVLTPAGRLVVLELTRPHRRLLRCFHQVYTRHAVPWLGRLLADETAYRYLAASVENFPEPARIMDELQAHRFVDVVPYRALSGGIVSLFVAQKADGAG